MHNLRLPYYVKLACSLISIVLIVFLIEKGKEIFIPLFLALLFSLLLYPITSFLERKLRLGKGAASMTALLLFLAAAGVFIYFIAIQVVGFTQDLPQLQGRLLNVYDQLHHWVTYKLKINKADQTGYINRSLGTFIETAGRSVGGVLAAATGLLFFIVFVFIFTYFILFHRKLLVKVALRLFPVPERGKVHEVILETRTMMYSYVVGLMLEMLIMSFANSILLLLFGA
ncbi:MAG: AI-2E family transporter, partial [Chitinophagia bacterium]|nr:AI-2E family transporter [Chitinophagia bacterium]